jgi:hypothetical protein
VKQLGESGAKPVFPKVLKCINCGCEVSVDSFDDMESGLLAFAWLPSPPNPPGAFQFGCPNKCGSCYVSACPDCRQQFHGATHVHYGGEDITHARFGERKLIKLGHQGLDLKEASEFIAKAAPPPAPADAPRQKFTYKRRPDRRKGGNDGPIPSSH